VDDKDAEIAALKAQLAQPKSRSGGAAVGTLKVIGVLAAVGIGGLLLLAIIGSNLPEDERPYSEKIAASCQDEFGSMGEVAVNDCRIKAMTAELYRQRDDAQSRAENAAR
jgi:hypothetical protein